MKTTGVIPRNQRKRTTSRSTLENVCLQYNKIHHMAMYALYLHVHSISFIMEILNFCVFVRTRERGFEAPLSRKPSLDQLQFSCNNAT